MERNTNTLFHNKGLQVFLTENVRDSGYLAEQYLLEEDTAIRNGRNWVHFGRASDSSLDDSESRRAVKKVRLDLQDYTDDGTVETASITNEDRDLVWDFVVGVWEAIIQKNKLDHIYIVKCYDAWVEPAEGKEIPTDDVFTVLEFLQQNAGIDQPILTDDVRVALINLRGMVLYLVMDAYHGDVESLLLKNLEMKNREKIIEYMASAVKYMHGEGYAHLDLKPKNILYRGSLGEGDLDIGIADFGLAKELHGEPEAVQSMSTLRGTSPYNSDPRKVYNKEFDIWSFGLIVYQILKTGAKTMTATELCAAVQKRKDKPDDTESFEDLNRGTELDFARMFLSCTIVDKEQHRCNADEIVSVFYS